MGKNSLKKNFFYNMLQNLSTILVPLLTSPYVARVLGVENIGIQSWTYSIVSYFILFSLLGINNYGNRSIALIKEDKEKIPKYFSCIYFIQIFMTFFIAILYLIYVLFLAREEYKIVLSIQSLYIISNFFDITWFFYGMEDFKTIAIRNFVIRILSLISVFIFIKTSNDLWKYVFILSVSTFLGQIFLWIFSIKKVKLIIPKFSEIKIHIKPIIILFIPVLAISVFSYMDKYMIGKFSKIAQNAFYENADKIISVPKILITILGTVMLPRTANMIAKGEDNQSKEYIRITMIYTSIFSSAFAFGLSSIADIFSIIFWGENFYESGVLIMYLTPALVFSVFGNIIRTQYLIPRSKDKEYTLSLIIGAILNFIINLLLIPKYGALGAVIGTVFAEIIMTSLQVYYVRKYLSIITYFKESIIFFVFGLIMFVVVRYTKKFFNNSFYTLFFLVLIGVLVYTLLIVVYISKSKKEIYFKIKNILRRKND